MSNDRLDHLKNIVALHETSWAEVAQRHPRSQLMKRWLQQEWNPWFSWFWETVEPRNLPNLGIHFIRDTTQSLEQIRRRAEELHIPIPDIEHVSDVNMQVGGPHGEGKRSNARGTYGGRRYDRVTVGVADDTLAHFESKTYDDLWKAQRDYLAKKRGFDRSTGPIKALLIPRSTNQDVTQLAAYWSKQLADAKQVSGYKYTTELWQVAMNDVNSYAMTGKPDDVYPKNNEFWHASLNVSIQVAIGAEAPSKWTMIVESLEHSVRHLPETLEDVARKTYETGAKAVGVLGTPLKVALYGGLAVGGLYMITRLAQGLRSDRR